jgi:DNA-directed RNA polymerase specialized sigma24 family protein
VLGRALRGSALDVDARGPAAAADEVEVLYRSLRGDLVRLAAVLVDDADLAEEIVQEAFTALYRR